MPLSNDVLTALAIERLEAVANDRYTDARIKMQNLEAVQKTITSMLQQLKEGDYHDRRS